MSSPRHRASRTLRFALCLFALAFVSAATLSTARAQPPKDVRRQDTPLNRDPRRPTSYEYEQEARNAQIGKEVDIALKQGNVACDATPPRYAEAEDAYLRAAKLNPKEARAYLGLGRVYAAQSRVPETVAAYRKAIELKPKFAEARFNLGLVLFVTGKREEALAEYEALRKLDPELAKRFKEFIDKQ
jgi:tetratricopeptide (TPR) repeat protein